MHKELKGVETRKAVSKTIELYTVLMKDQLKNSVLLALRYDIVESIECPGFNTLPT